jgi:hypothetical protein
MAKPMIDRTFIRAQDGNGKWINATLRELSHEEFRDWAVAWYKRAGATLNFGPTVTTPEEREGVIKHMVKVGIPPVMLRDDSDEPPDG